MYSSEFIKNIEKELEALKQAGKLKVERELASAQGPEVELAGKPVLMFASNNYLGLGNHPEILAAAEKGMKEYGYGLSSVRFLSGTQTIHRQLEQKLAAFLGTEDVILYSTNFMANLGFFASIVNEGMGSTEWKDVIYSDELNHASIIDAFKLCKKENLEKRIYKHGNLEELENFLKADEASNYRNKIIVTDGIFSMEGSMADLPKLVELAEKYQALLFVDDAHAVGVLGATGAGTPERLGVKGKIDVYSGTFGKALGGAVGGYIAGKKSLTEFLRQKSRTYMFSNTVPPSVVIASMKALDMLREKPELLKNLKDNSAYFREKVAALGFTLIPGEHAIVPIMLGDAKVAQDMSRALLAEGLYVVGLWFPVVPEGSARLRFQISAAHTKEHLDRAISILGKIGKEMKII